MNLETKYDDGLGLIIKDTDNNQHYVCNDKTDMDILCQKVNDELNYVIIRHNMMVRSMMKIEANLKDLNQRLEMAEEFKGVQK